MIVYDHVYCVLLNLFSKDSHKDSCCMDCIIALPDHLFKRDSWFPKQEIDATKITYTLDGEHWIRYKMENQ